MKTEFEKQVLVSLQQSINEAVKACLTSSYSSPLTKYVNEIVGEQEEQIKAVLRGALAVVVRDEQFKLSVVDAFTHKIGRTLVDQLDGSVKQAAEKLRQDPTIKAQMILAIEKIVKDNLKD